MFASAELVTLASGLRLERRLVPLARELSYLHLTALYLQQLVQYINMFSLSKILQKRPAFLYKWNKALHRVAIALNTSKLAEKTSCYAVKGM